MDNRRENIKYELRRSSFTRNYENVEVDDDDGECKYILFVEYNVLKLYTNEGSGLTKRCHVFVYECFNGVVPNGYEIDHIDTNKSNNELKNLQCLSVINHRDNPHMEKNRTETIKAHYYSDKLRNKH